MYVLAKTIKDNKTWSAGYTYASPAYLQDIYYDKKYSHTVMKVTCVLDEALKFKTKEGAIDCIETNNIKGWTVQEH